MPILIYKFFGLNLNIVFYNNKSNKLREIFLI